MSRAPFLWIARFEGLSLLLLVFVAMPIKYGLHNEDPVRYVGMGHGLLFISYVVAMGLLARAEGWDAQRIGLALFAAVVPGGTFAFEYSLERGESPA